MRFLPVILAASFVMFSDSASGQLKNPYADVLTNPMKLELKADDEKASTLLKKHFNATHKEMRYRYNYWRQDIGGIDAFINSINRLHAICVELAPEQEEKLLEYKLKFADEILKQCEKGISKARFESIRSLNEVSVQAFRTAIELEMAKLKSSQSLPKKDK